MQLTLVLVVEWVQAALLAVLSWLVVFKPQLAPLAAGAAVALEPLVRRRRAAEPWASFLVGASALVFLTVTAGWRVGLGWFGLGGLVGLAARWLPARRRPDAADLLALLGWSGTLLLRPELLALQGGGFVGPAVLLVASLRLGRAWRRPGKASTSRPEAPSREVRGTLSLRGLVTAGQDGLARSVPIDLDLRAGDALAVLCDAPADGEALAATLAGRRRPLVGEVVVDGAPPGRDDRLVAVVGEGEPFLVGALEDNLAALCEEELEQDSLAAVWEACSLEEVAVALGDRDLAPDGQPLDPFHRLLLLVARVIPSGFRIVVVVDPMPWVNAVRRELWRAALVRAAVGRTTVWITADRELAARASRVVELRNGALRPLTGPP